MRPHEKALLLWSESDMDGVSGRVLNGFVFMVIIQLAVIFMFLAIGEFVVWFTGVPVPSSIIGMLMLTAALRLGVVRLRHVEGVAGVLVKNLGFFFIPAGVAMIDFFPVLRSQWLPIVASSAISTVIVLCVTGHFHQVSRKYLARHAGK